LGRFVAFQTPQGKHHVAPADPSQHPVERGRRRGEQENAFAARGNLGEKLGHHTRLPRPRQALQEAQIRSVQRLGHRLALPGIKGGILDLHGRDRDRFQGVGLTREELG
jgi:hypothetical protein